MKRMRIKRTAFVRVSVKPDDDIYAISSRKVMRLN